MQESYIITIKSTGLSTSGLHLTCTTSRDMRSVSFHQNTEFYVEKLEGKKIIQMPFPENLHMSEYSFQDQIIYLSTCQCIKNWGTLGILKWSAWRWLRTPTLPNNVLYFHANNHKILKEHLRIYIFLKRDLSEYICIDISGPQLNVSAFNIQWELEKKKKGGRSEIYRWHWGSQTRDHTHRRLTAASDPPM